MFNWDYDTAVSLLSVKYGIPKQQIVDGSVPEKSLDYILTTIEENFEHTISALHVGNFVGVSLAHLIQGLRWISVDTTSIVSIDPNLNHRGVSNPQSIVVDLLHHFGLDKYNHLLICGYTLEKCKSNDSNTTYNGYEPEQEFDKEVAPQYVLSTHCTEAGTIKFDVIFIDGNHEEGYPPTRTTNLYPSSSERRATNP